MLRACLFALATGNTVSGFAGLFGFHFVMMFGRMQIMIGFEYIHDIKDLRDSDAFRAAGRTIMAAGTGDGATFS